jgi:biotin carboxylase
MDAFRAAAARLDIELVTGLDVPAELAAQWPDALPLSFRDEAAAVQAIADYAAVRPLDAIVAVDDSGSLLAARASARLGLPHNAPEAALAARDKYVMRRMLRRGGVPTPEFSAYPLNTDIPSILAQTTFPVVVKPLDMNGSRGVMRADDAEELATAVDRLRRIVDRASGDRAQSFLVERYLPGVEVAVEGLLDDGRFHMLALFDKPDPLVGPFFEETIYVTPSRLPGASQAAVATATEAAARAVGLTGGPVHAELRLNDEGAWIVEIAGRSIGGKCSDVLRFGIDASLEELILRQACGRPLETTERAGGASGVMMIPIPAAGLLRRVEGIEAAEATPLIERVEISATLNYPLVPLPEGDSYLGFIFARGATPEAVEQALRDAHAALGFTIDPVIELTPA